MRRSVVGLAASMEKLPHGTVTLLFTDMEGSTRLLQEVGLDKYVPALEDHRRLLRDAFTERGGVEVEMQGESFFFAFADAREAVLAAADAQRALGDHNWEIDPIRVRIGIHTGNPLVTGRLYAGLDVHQAARVMSAGHGGQVLVSATTQAMIEAGPLDGLSLRDLGEHRLKDLSAPQRLYQLGDEEFPPLKSLYQTNLPVAATPFLGRQRELQEVSALLAESEVRLVTLTGAGGTGKTRLSAQAAADVSELYPDGVFWVGLASLRDPALVTATIAQTLGAKEVLADHIGSKRLLLLLDNFEHLADATTEVAGLLSACPELTLLVTSRERLHLSAEREYAVLPLRESDAISLFHERVRATGTEIGVGIEVIEICRRLDHLPLAIELAASRVKVLSVRELLERLEQRLPLLTGGANDLPERQRTLRSTIQWSFDLLAQHEQRLFARLSVFAGGCTLGAAEAICGADLDSLQSLVDKSLLRHTNERFWMLETIREYATQRLAESGEGAELRDQHAHWYVDLGERAYDKLREADQAIWLEELEQDHDNFRSVFDLKLGAGESETALRLASVLSRFWIMRGYLAEGSRWLETCLRSAGTSAARPRALRGLAILSMEQGQIDRAAEAAEEALALDRVSGDEDGAGQSMGILADVVAFRGDLAAAEGLYEQAAELARRRGNRLELAITLYNLGHLTRLQGDLPRAAGRLEEALAIFGELGDAMGEAAVLQGLVEMASESGEYERAFSFLRASTELLKEIRYVSGLLDSLATSAGLLAKLGEGESSARLWGAYHVLGKEIGREAAHPLEAAARDESVGAVREALGDEAFERAWAKGLSMTLDEAVTFALEQRSAARQPA
jgi:predicted ATPase/class 3 adenylate cyclase